MHDALDPRPHLFAGDALEHGLVEAHDVALGEEGGDGGVVVLAVGSARAEETRLKPPLSDTATATGV